MKEYAVPLRLVSPHMKGVAVRDAQYLMKGHNRFEGLAPFKDGVIDSDYGPITAGATRRTKYWLGYPEVAIDSVFGQTLYEYLRPNEWRPLPEAYQERRAARLKAAQLTPGLKAFQEAVTHIGYREEPQHNTNDNMFGRWYGWNHVAWCAIFASYCFSHSGWSRFRYASVEAIYWDAAAQRNGLRLVYSPQRGDLVGYRIDSDAFAHTAFFDHWLDSGTFEDLGGNTGPANISNGGMVLRQQRSKNLVHYYARVG